MDVSHLLDGLNPAQREAVSAAPGHYLVLAGAGSGKTRVLTHRIAWLNEVHGVPVHSIFAVTFTNKAAGEMRHRADAQLRQSGSGPGSRGMWIGTFHGLAHRLLRLHWQEAKLPESFQVLDSDDQLRLVKRVVQQMELDEARFPPRQIAWWINAQKDEGRRAQHIQPGDDQWTDTLRRAYALYQERCDRAGLVDFAELLLRAHEVLRDNPALLGHYRSRFREILVDEFQDTNSIQYGFVRLLAGDSGHVFVVGDDDQAIYGWRGAKVENVQRFLKDFPGAQTIRLEQNYRSSANILNAANAVIAHNPDRIGKQLWTDTGDGESIDLYAAYNEVDEARYVVERIRQWVRDGGSYVEAAVLYRSNAQSRAFEEVLLAEQVPYRVYAACASSSAPRSRTPWPTCAWSPTAPTTRPSSARSTRPRAASATAPWTKCASARVRVRNRCSNRRANFPSAMSSPAARAMRWPDSSAWSKRCRPKWPSSSSRTRSTTC